MYYSLLLNLLGVLSLTRRISSDRIFGVASASLASVQGTPETCPKMEMCAVLCGGDDSCTQAVHDDVTGTCTKSSVIGLFRGKNEPDDISIPLDGHFGTLDGGTLLYTPVVPITSRPASCADIHAQYPSAPSGVYFIWLGPGRIQHRVWCDMDTDGGGWTMVYSYKTLELTLTAGSNAVSPIPTWDATEATLVTSSTTPPSDLYQYGALDFSLWLTIGEEFMIKSNINNWIACTPGTGSFSRYQPGTLNCRMIKSITTECPDLPSGTFTFAYNNRGPSVKFNNKFFYYYDGTTSGNWPTHDPCGQNAANHLKGLHPRGQIWIRE